MNRVICGALLALVCGGAFATEQNGDVAETVMSECREFAGLADGLGDLYYGECVNEMQRMLSSDLRLGEETASK